MIDNILPSRLNPFFSGAHHGKAPQLQKEFLPVVGPLLWVPKRLIPAGRGTRASPTSAALPRMKRMSKKTFRVWKER